MDNFGFILLITVLFLPWVGVLFYYITRKRRALKYYHKLQEKYALTREDGGKNKTVISGYYRSRPVKLESGILDGHNKANTLLTVGCLNPDNLEFTIQNRKKSNYLVFSRSEFKLDDNEFDNKFIIDTNNIEKLKKLFDFNTRYKLQQIHGLGFLGQISLQGNSFNYSVPGLPNNDASLMKLELVLHELCDLADVMKYN